MRTDNDYYVDKTGYCYNLVKNYKFVFLSRPRRFGKSLFTTTLKSYFEGRKDLFTGLIIESLEKDWTAYPVILLDMSISMGDDLSLLHSCISNQLAKYERKYDVSVDPVITGDYSARLGNIITRANELTGRQAVVLIDEYDAPMQEQLTNPELMDSVRTILLNLYLSIKQNSGLLRFAFLTGITKFAQMSLFSKLNNITDISMLPEYDAICGVTQDEMEEYFDDGIDQLAKANNETREGAIAHIKTMYDGYHFNEDLHDIYNPYSLINVLSSKKYRNYWFSSGTPTMLIKMMQKFKMSYVNLEEPIKVSESTFDAPMEQLDDANPLLYQSGYLTIKEYNKQRNQYVLGLPNKEVQVGLAESLYKFYRPQGLYSRDTLLNAYYDLMEDGDINAFMEAVKRFYLTIPYDLDNKNERHYQALFYAAMKSFGTHIEAEKHTANGRIDIVMYMPEKIYVLEFKYQKSAAEALDQVIQKDYKTMFADDNREVVQIGMNVSADLRSIDSWEYIN